MAKFKNRFPRGRGNGRRNPWMSFSWTARPGIITIPWQ